MPRKQKISTPKPVIEETVVSMDEATFFNLMESLFRDQDAVGLILMLDELTNDAITSWRQTKDSTVDEITEARDVHLLPVLYRLGRVCLNAIQFHQSIVCEEGLDRLARIYDLGRYRELGIAQDGLHLSWTVPSKHAFTQLYIVGGYAVFRQQMKTVGTLLELRVRDRYRRDRIPILSHPHYEHRSGEGDTRAYFDDAQLQVIDTPALYMLFFLDEDEVIDSLCQFDFISAYSLWRQQKSSHLNFGRFPNSRTMPIIERLLESTVRTTLFDSFEPRHFADFLRRINAACTHMNRLHGWQPGEWTDDVRNFLREYPPEQEEA